MKKIIVVSAINIFEGGTLTILKECLEYLSADLSSQFKIIALVHDSKQLGIKNIGYIEYNRSRKNWLFRAYYEYVHFYFLSKQIKPHLWLSLHDISPNVVADIRAVYCHNPSPFYPFSLHTLVYSYKIALFSLFYKFLYKINIHKNNYVIVQQNWIRKSFESMYSVKNVIVSYPGLQQTVLSNVKSGFFAKTTFLYPALPRVFKNFEVIAEAAKLLFEQGTSNFDVLLTISGDENKFARYIIKKYKDIPTISFIGLKTRDEIFALYRQVDALIFSSKLETWGLPITEAKQFDKPMILSDLPYARETVGSYDKVKFFQPDDCFQLADFMKSFIDKSLVYDGNKSFRVQRPFAENWKELFEILLGSRE